ncbi:hypothetical protein V502_00269 [Pseudogymnoascus sp. VKM F-4520 (FW-2644)]|nr:hypothetical protein V502_00269 [Pseudogymnoascus sp. VKM F-4520 (FW-2644)]
MSGGCGSSSQTKARVPFPHISAQAAMTYRKSEAIPGVVVDIDACGDNLVKLLREVDIGQQLKEMIGLEAGVSWSAGARVTGDHERGQPSIGHYGDGRREDDVIPIAGAESERGDDDCGGPIEVVGGEFTRAMYGTRNLQYPMGYQPTGAHGPGGIRAARVGHHSVVCTVFEPVARVRPVGPDDMKKASAAMVRRRVQMMYLTATLAPVDMPEFMEVIKVQIPADNIFSDSTSRRNIAYSSFSSNFRSSPEIIPHF